jgi:hypothetical protein
LTKGKSNLTTSTVAGADDFRLSHARKALQEELGTDRWSITRLGSLWHDDAAQEHVIRAVWVEPIGALTRQAATL